MSSATPSWKELRAQYGKSRVDFACLVVSLQRDEVRARQRGLFDFADQLRQVVDEVMSGRRHLSAASLRHRRIPWYMLHCGAWSSVHRSIEFACVRTSLDTLGS